MKIGVLFDLDGTLLDTLEDLKDAVNYMLRSFGLPERSMEEIRAFVGNGVRNLMIRSLPGTPQDPPVEEALQVYKEYYQSHSQVKTKPYAGVEEAVKAVQKKYAVAIVSNKQDEAVKPLCAQFFPGIYALGETKDCPRKPHPEIVHRVMKDLGVDGCVYVGDSEVDVQTACNANVPCLSVLWGFRDQEVLAQAGGVYFCQKPEEIPEMMERIVKEVYGQ